MTSLIDNPRSNPQIPTRWFRYKKRNIDICNLCRQKRLLSNDHVPPQGAAEIEEIEVRSLFGFLVDQQERPTFIQNDLKYRTLCRDCNTLIGTYDRELIRFSNFVRASVRTSILIPDRIMFTGRPNAIILALAGHLVAAKMQLDEVRFDEDARRIIFEPDMPVPDDWNAYYWIFPFTSTVVIRDVMLLFLDSRKRPHVFAQLLKYFPLAFMICDSDEFPFSRLTVAKCKGCQNESGLVVDLAQKVGEHWPEAPADDRVIFMGDAGARSARAAPRLRRVITRQGARHGRSRLAKSRSRGRRT